MSRPKREYKERPTSLEDVMREYLATLPLDTRLRAALEYEARKQTIAVNKQRGVVED